MRRFAVNCLGGSSMGIGKSAVPGLHRLNEFLHPIPKLIPNSAVGLFPFFWLARGSFRVSHGPSNYLRSEWIQRVSFPPLVTQGYDTLVGFAKKGSDSIWRLIRDINP